MIKKSRAELELLPLKILKGLDITSPEEEKMIQEIILSKTVVAEPLVVFNQRQVPDIKNPEDEKIWQDKIDKFNSENTPVEAKVAQAEKALEAVKAEVQAEAPQQVVPQTPIENQEPLATPEVVVVQDGKIIKPFCDKCSSKGVRHLKICPNYVSLTKTDAEGNIPT